MNAPTLKLTTRAPFSSAYRTPQTTLSRVSRAGTDDDSDVPPAFEITFAEMVITRAFQARPNPATPLLPRPTASDAVFVPWSGARSDCGCGRLSFD
jgi:hypothetical protein